MLPPDGADTPASRIFRINSAGTGSGFSRRIDRVVAMISNRFAVSSGMTPSRPSVRLHIPGYTKARAELGHVQRLRKSHPLQRLPRGIQPNPHSGEVADLSPEPRTARRHLADRQGSGHPPTRRRHERIHRTPVGLSAGSPPKVRQSSISAPKDAGSRLAAAS